MDSNLSTRHSAATAASSASLGASSPHMHGAVVSPAPRFSSIASPNTSLAPRASPSASAADAYRGSLTPVPAAGAYLVGDGSQSPVVFRSVKIDAMQSSSPYGASSTFDGREASESFAAEHYGVPHQTNEQVAALGMHQSMGGFGAQFSSFGGGLSKAAFGAGAWHASMSINPKMAMTTTVEQPSVGAAPVSVPRPPNCPLFIEPNHFYSKCAPALIRQHLEEICVQMRVDVMPGSGLFSMACSAYVEHASVDFWLSIFTDDKSSAEERYLIEIQRRSGDGHAFQEAVRGLRASLGERRVIEKAAAAPKRGWGDKAKAAIAARTKSCGPDALARLQAMQPQAADGCVFRSVSAPEARAAVPLPASAYAAFPIVETDDVVAASVNHAVALAASPYEDVKSEAVQSLAGMAAQEQSQRALLAAAGADGRAGEGVKVAVACLRALTPDVHRCAASTLANLLSAPSAAVAAAARELVARHDGATELFRLMLRDKCEQQPESAPVSPQVLRECARALIALYGGDASASGRPEKPQSADAVGVVQKLRAHYCPLVREYADRLDAVVRTV